MTRNIIFLMGLLILIYNLPRLAYAERETTVMSPFPELPIPGSSTSKAIPWLKSYCQTPSVKKVSADSDVLRCDSYEWQGQQVSLEFMSANGLIGRCLLYTSPSPRDQRGSRMPSSA